MLQKTRRPKWLERELTDRKVRGSNPTCASRLPLCLGLGNLAVSRPSCFLWVAWQLGTERVRGSNPTSASRLPLSRLGQPGSLPALVLPLSGMAARHRNGVTAEQFF
ncbi:hypothetical protein CSKR_109533 [Clonorchis sinensis]|uniref:Uncharacterized protein n=1 Tax=Clonorchis sinensis TaxID=79923 RepID=A0A419PQR7_CLOSI|nr:hypothetical protein CSKR_109533 [Clonorchis sinensis]